MNRRNVALGFSVLMWVVLALAAIPASSRAAARVWGGSANGDWFAPGNWTGGLTPSDGDAVVIGSGSAILTNSTPSLDSFTITNATLTFSNAVGAVLTYTNILTATNVWIGGTLTHASNLAVTNNLSGQWDVSNRVYIVCSNLTLATNGSINVSQKGFRGGVSGAATHREGYGPGGGKAGAGGRGGGGSYGGRGGRGNSDTALFSTTYGQADSPIDPGSGGGAKSSSPGDGGAGGGYVRVQASGLVTLHGSITADAGNGVSDSGGGGSGGGVWISCGTFAGSNGLISANGGDGLGGWGGGGGGGRIAVSYDAAAQAASGLRPTVRFSVKNGVAGSYGESGDLGTLYFTDTLALPDIMLGWNGRPSFASATSWSPNACVLSNGWMAFPGSFGLGVTNGLSVIVNARLDTTNAAVSCGSLTVANSIFNAFRGGASQESLSSSGDVVINNGTLNFWYALTNPASLTIGGNLVLTNGAKCYLYSGMTNAAGPNYGGLLDLSGRDVLIAGNCVLYPVAHPTNGGSILMRTRNLTVPYAAQINGDALGFGGGVNGIHAAGYGPGGGGSSTRGGGGGHGGFGGKGNDGTLAPAGLTNDIAAAPLLPGSGGGGKSDPLYPGGNGGSLVRIEATGPVTIDGTISVNGAAGPGDSAGGGAGGGIYLTCKSLGGTGTLQANGGSAPSLGGGGGGGRIAVWWTSHPWDDVLPAQPTNSVLGATSGYQAGSNGTVFVSVDVSAPRIDNKPAPPAGITANEADLVGSLTSTGAAATTVMVYWGQTDGVDVRTNWSTNAIIGVRSPGDVTNHVAGLTAGALYFYRFYATNAFGEDWGTPQTFFTTAGLPDVNNDIGATSITLTSAVLHGFAQGSPNPTVTLYWGTNYTGTDPLLWNQHIDIGVVTNLYFSGSATGLIANQTYSYRCFATNDNGGKWAASATNFPTASPTVSLADVSVVEGNAGMVSANFLATLSAPSAADVLLAFATSNGSATAGADYVATNGTCVISAGATSAVITVAVIGDTIDEYPSENFYLSLTNATLAVLGRSQAVGTIVDDDTTVETKTWSGTGLWNSVTNWQPLSQSIPDPSDTVIIPAGTVCTLTDTGRAVSVTVSGNLTFSGPGARLQVTDLLVNTNGFITHNAQTATGTNSLGQWVADNGIYVDCANATVLAGGRINGDSKGYAGGTYSPVSHQAGYGPGGGPSFGRGSGGSYGGQGGKSFDAGASSTYGVAAAPAEPGSGGGSKQSAENGGGAGGGYVCIQATSQVLVNGTISVNGQGAYDSDSGGGGSGGGVRIACRTFVGTNGLISANGGAGAYSGAALGGGGGGGRIAVSYDVAAENALGVQPTVTFSARNGAGYGDPLSGADIGTVYVPNTFALREQLRGWSGRLTFGDGASSWAPANLTLSNGWVAFPSGFALNVTGDVQVIVNARLDTSNAVVNCGGRLMATGSSVFLFRGSGSAEQLTVGGDTFLNNSTLSFWYALTNPSSLTLTGNLTLTNGGKCYLYSGVTNGASRNYGGLLELSGRNLVIPTNSAIYPVSNPTNGGSILMRMNNLTVDAGGQVNADSYGFAGGSVGHAGNGPGGGGSVSRGGGGGHGGKGGNGQDAAGGVTNDAVLTPLLPGSGGGAKNAGSYSGGNGGGLVRVEATGTVTLNGALSALGGPYTGDDSPGGGAGGGIYVRCYRMNGSGPMTANGGAGAGLGGGGGGGRIAVWAIFSNYVGTVTVSGGSGGNAAGDPGTYVWVQIPPPGTVFELR